MRVVGRSGCVMDLPDQLARALLRDGSVWPVEESPATPAPARADAEPDEKTVEMVDYAAAGRTTSPQPDNAAVRAWAQDHGYDVSPRGKIPAAVLSAYREAHGL